MSVQRSALLLALHLAAAYDFLPYGHDRPLVATKRPAAAVIIQTEMEPLKLDGARVMREARSTADGSRIVVLDAIPESCAGFDVVPIDAGPFNTAEDASALCKRWLDEFWRCSREDGAENNSCAPWGGCHRRCWWRDGSTIALEFVERSAIDAISSPSLTYLREQSAHDADPATDALVLQASLVSLDPETHYVGLRPKGTPR